jgi:hypothetical protein
MYLWLGTAELKNARVIFDNSSSQSFGSGCFWVSKEGRIMSKESRRLAGILLIIFQPSSMAA